MTTIVWDGKQMIGDTLGIWGGSKFKIVKVMQHGDILMGGSGSWVEMSAFYTWVKSGMELKNWPAQDITKEGCTILMAHKDGRVMRFEGSPYPTPLIELPQAIGSGTDCVMGAMAHGATAMEAMEIAKKLDASTGGELTVLQF